MKIIIEIDCSAQEAREMLGLPDVQELQQEWLEKIKTAMLADPESFAPDKVLANWTKAAAPNLEMMPDILQSFLKAAMTGSK